MSEWIFGYGSLINTSSISRTLKRDISIKEVLPVFVSGYKRGWYLTENVHSDYLSKEITVAFLDIVEEANHLVNGVIFQVSSSELINLKKREKNYNCVDISNSVNLFANEQDFQKRKVSAFVSKSQHRTVNYDNEIFVMERYLRMVEDGCLEFGETFLNKYQDTTEEIPFPILKGKYTFLDKNQAENV